MYKLPLKQVFLVGALSLAITGSAFAISPNAKAEEAQQTAQERQDAAKATVLEKKAAAQTKLADAKLKACEKRETAVKNIMNRITDRNQKQIKTFDAIAARTQAFYATKGKTLANYDALVADVAAKKTAAETALAEVQSNSTEFNCDGDDPKGSVAAFKVAAKNQVAALKAYKTAIKNLIVGVKSVQGTTSSGRTSTSPSPSPSVSATTSPSPTVTASPSTAVNQDQQ